jgi:uncharacterized membrane protein YgaE (UPF0421/DUF939 family)
VIKEPDVIPKNVSDLSDVSLLQTILLLFAIPCVICIQFYDLLRAVERSYQRYYSERAAAQYSLPQQKKIKKNKKGVVENNNNNNKKKKNFGRRLFKTLTKWFRRPK